MSARVESTPVRGSASRPLVIAVVAALGLGALAVGMVRLTADDGPATVTTRAPLWDVQKLEAMEGRVLAAAVATQPAAWDAQKLEAMEGRVLAAAVGAEDPIIAPHIPWRAPRE